MVPFDKQQQRKKLKRSRIWKVPCILILIVTTHSIFSMWLCCLLWIFYQAITGTGLAWVCLSARTWRGAPLLDVDFPLLVFDLGFFAISDIFSKIFFLLRCLYFTCTQIPQLEGETSFFLSAEVQGNISEMIPGRIREIDFIVVIKAVSNYLKCLIPSYG